MADVTGIERLPSPPAGWEIGKCVASDGETLPTNLGKLFGLVAIGSSAGTIVSVSAISAGTATLQVQAGDTSTGVTDDTVYYIAFGDPQ